MAIKSPIQQQLEALEAKAAVLDQIVAVAKTPGGRLTGAGKNLVYILRLAGMRKSDVAKILHVTPAALTNVD